MGREAVCNVCWHGDAAEVKVLLESHEIILRGAIKAKISRHTLLSAQVKGDQLVVQARAGTLTLDLGKPESEK
jgi:hypothetical protein